MMGTSNEQRRERERVGGQAEAQRTVAPVAERRKRLSLLTHINLFQKVILKGC
jgi:hypothetical protein